MKAYYSLLGDMVGQGGGKGPAGVGYLHLDVHRPSLPVNQDGLALINERLVHALLQLKVLADGAAEDGDVGPQLGRRDEDAAQVDRALLVAQVRPGLEELGPPDQVLELADAQLGHVAPDLEVQATITQTKRR